MIHLGRVYARFLNDADTALMWFHKANDAGFTESHVELAMIFDAVGSPLHNPSEAVKWWHVVAEESDGKGSYGRAAIALANHYRNGRGVPYDRDLARSWLEKVLEKCGTKSAFYRDAVKLLAKMDEDFI
jgi:TPR repeat protein